MNEKQIAKRYLLSLGLLYIIGAVLLAAFVFVLSSRDDTATLQVNQIILLSVLLPLLPCSSYAGFCTAFLKVGELTKKQMIIIVVLFPLVLVAITIYGAAMLIPSIIKGAKALHK